MERCDTSFIVKAKKVSAQFKDLPVFANVPYNNANQHELESSVFIVAVWSCEGIKAATVPR